MMSLKIISLLHLSKRTVKMPSTSLSKLSMREWEVLLLLTEGRSAAYISDRLCIERKSVHNNKNRIGKKLKLSGLGELNTFARAHGEELVYWFGILVPEVNESLYLRHAEKRRIEW